MYFLCYESLVLLVIFCWSCTKLFLKSWNIFERLRKQKSAFFCIWSSSAFLIISLNISNFFQNMPGISSFWLKAKRNYFQFSRHHILHIIVINTEYKLPSFHAVEDKFPGNILSEISFSSNIKSSCMLAFMWLCTVIYLACMISPHAFPLSKRQ